MGHLLYLLGRTRYLKRNIDEAVPVLTELARQLAKSVVEISPFHFPKISFL